MNAKDMIRFYEATIKSLPGMTIDRIEQGQHIKFYLTTPSGKKVFVAPRSPSDKRAFQNNKSLLARWSKGEHG